MLQMDESIKASRGWWWNRSLYNVLILLLVVSFLAGFSFVVGCTVLRVVC
jgi:hypothetical protein